MPIIKLVLIGALAGVVGVLTVLGRQAFFAEAITHVTSPGMIIGVVIVAVLGLSHSWASVFLSTGAFLMCTSIGALFGLSKVGTTSSAAGIVLTFGFALGCFLDKWLASLPAKAESFLAGNALSVNKIDIALSGGLSLLVTVVLATRWRQLICSTFGSEFFGATHLRGKAQLVISGLIVLILVVLIPAVGTILSIALLAVPAAVLAGVVNDTRLLFMLVPLIGIAIGLMGLFIAMAANLSVGGCTGVCAGCSYVPLKIATIRNNARA